MAWRIKAAICLTYVVFAVLLNSVGTVILQSIEHFGIDKITASTLEAYKDLPIAVTSFLVASLLPRIGLRRGMIAGLLLVALACLAMPLLDSFTATRLLFVAVGIGFALAKVGVYSIVGLVTHSSSGHASLLNFVEGLFMVAVLSGYWLFSLFIDPVNPGSDAWLDVYWWLAGACAAAALLLAVSPLDESRTRAERSSSPRADFVAMLRLAARGLSLVFIASVFLYVLIEQGIGTWLPTFNKQVLGLSAQLSVQAASIFAAGLALGRLAASIVVQRTGWFYLVIGCLLGVGTLIALAIPSAGAVGSAVITAWRDAPVGAIVFPLIGFFMGPIYPAINSAILAALPCSSHAAMVGLIVVFSALGGTLGSLIIGRAFAATGGASAYYLLLAPVLLLLLALIGLRRLTPATDADLQPGTA